MLYWLTNLSSFFFFFFFCMRFLCWGALDVEIQTLCDMKNGEDILAFYVCNHPVIAIFLHDIQGLLAKIYVQDHLYPEGECILQSKEILTMQNRPKNIEKWGSNHIFFASHFTLHLLYKKQLVSCMPLFSIYPVNLSWPAQYCHTCQAKNVCLTC